MQTIELGPAGQDGDSFNMSETRKIWEAIERASEDGETTVLTISGEPAATIGPPPMQPDAIDAAAKDAAEQERRWSP